MGKSIRVSKEYGLNPSVTRCVCCGRDYGVALFGAGWKDPKTGKTAEAPREVYNGLCEDCQGVVDKGGVMVIEVMDGETGNNPYRTGRIVGCSKEFKERNKIGSPVIYMEKSVFSQLFDAHLENHN